MPAISPTLPQRHLGEQQITQMCLLIVILGDWLKWGGAQREGGQKNQKQRCITVCKKWQQVLGCGEDHAKRSCGT